MLKDEKSKYLQFYWKFEVKQKMAKNTQNIRQHLWREKGRVNIKGQHASFKLVVIDPGCGYKNLLTESNPF